MYVFFYKYSFIINLYLYNIQLYFLGKSYVIEALHFHFHKLKQQITTPQTIRNSFRQPGGFPLQKV